MKLFIDICRQITNIALRIKKTPVLAVALMLFSLVLAGQQYPVKVVPQLLPPYSLILSDYYSGTIPKLTITLINTDVQQPLLNVRLRMTIKNGGSIVARSKENLSFPIITLLAGVPQRVSLNDLAPYFNPANLNTSALVQGRLPEGSYEFAFEVLESNTGALISNTGSAYAFITLNDPPFLNLPLHDAKYSTRIINNQPIVFTWTPRNQSDPNSAFTTEYEFQIVEEGGGYLGAAFDNRQPLFTATTDAPVFVYGLASPQLIPGKYYIWRVRARNKNGIDYQNTFKNNGYSEIRWFKYEQAACPPVQGLTSFIQNNTGDIRISWLAGNTGQTKMRYRFMYGEYRNAQYVYNLFWTPWFDAPDLANSSSYNISKQTKWLRPGGNINDRNDYVYIATPGTITEYNVTDVCNIIDNSASTASGKIEYPSSGAYVNFSINGSLLMAYRNSESASALVNPSLLTTEAPPDSQANIPINTEPSGGKFPLKGVNVILTNTNGGNVIGTAVTLASGSFKLPFSGNEEANMRTNAVTITYHDPSGIFNDKSFNFPNGLAEYETELSGRISSSTSSWYDIPDNVLLVPSFRFKPSVTLTTVTNGNISLDVLLPDDNNTADAMKVMQTLSLATNPAVVMFNGKRHKIITTFTDGRQFKRLISNTNDFPNYIIRVNFNDTSAFFPLNTIGKTADNIVTSIDKTFGVYGSTNITGVVNFRSVPQSNVNLSLKINQADILDVSNTRTTYDLVTDANGNYSCNLPKLKTGAKINFIIRAEEIRLLPFKDSVLYTGNAMIKDIYLQNNVYTITGRLADQQNNSISNALVTVKGSSESSKTSPAGFYMLKVYGDELSTASFTVDGYPVKQQTFTPGITYDLVKGDVALTSPGWIKALKLTREVVANPQLIPANILTSEIMGTGNGPLQENYPYFFDASETLKGVIDLGRTTYTLPMGTLKLNIPFHGELVKARIKLENTIVSKLFDSTSTAGAVYNAQLSAGHYNINISSIPGAAVFVSYFGEFDINGEQTTELTVKLADGVLVRGQIKNKVSDVNIDSVSLAVTGTPYTTVTDTAGNFCLVLPQNDAFRFRLTQKNYNALDTSLSTYYDSTYIREDQQTFTGHYISFNLFLQEKDITLPAFKTMSGFPVEVEKIQSASQTGTYLISGKLQVGDNGIFTAISTDNKNILTFKELAVRTDSTAETNAVPMADVAFEEAVLYTKAFTSFPIEVTGMPKIMLKGLKEGNRISWRHGVIGGQKLKATFRTMSNQVKLPIMLWDAYLYSMDSSVYKADSIRRLSGLAPFVYVYSSPNYLIAALSAEQKYSMDFLQPDSIFNKTVVGDDPTGYKRADSGYVQSKILMIKFMIERKTAVLNKFGLALNGYLQLPKIVAAKVQGDSSSTAGRIRIKKFLIDKNLAVEQLSFQVSKDSALGVGIGKVRLKITDINLYGLNGSNLDNIGLGFAGTVSLTKDDDHPQRDTIIIKSLYFRKFNDEWMVGASLGTGVSGWSMKSMVFKTTGIQSIDMSYNIDAKSYELLASGTLEYNRNRTDAATNADEGTRGALKDIFPIEIQSFKLRTKDFALFVAAKANIKKSLGPVTISVDRLVVNIGYEMSVDAMKAFLVGGTSQGASNGTARPEDPLDESKASWAVGIVGGLEFPVNGLEAKAGGAMIIANVNNNVQVKLDSVYVSLTSPAVTAKASFALSLSGFRRGFEGAASMNLASKEVSGSLKYYQYVGGGIELGGSIKVAGSGPGGVVWTTGPVQWYAVGGGFNLNFAEQKYMVFLTGDAGPVGSTKEASYVKDARLEVLFDVEACGWKPIIKGSGSLVVKGKQWGTAGITLDFCKFRLIATVNASVEIEKIQVEVAGVLYAKAPYNGQEGSLFFAVNGTMSGMGGLMSGNVFVALGVNYSNIDPDAPQEARNMWNLIDAAAKDDDGTNLNGLYIKGSYGISQRGGFDVSLKGFSIVSFDYGFSANQSVAVFVKFSDGNFMIKVMEAAHVYANLSVLIVDIGASGDAAIALSGGYDGSWWFRGNGSIRVEIYNDGDKSCNSFSIGTRWLVVPYPYFKFCVGLGAGFSYRQGQGLSFSLGKAEDVN